MRDDGRLRPDLKTWRFLNAAYGTLSHCLAAAKDEDLEGLVGAQLRHAGMYLAGALATLEVVGPEGATHDPVPATPVMLSITQLDQLVAVLSGTLSRLDFPGELTAQLEDLRTVLLEADLGLRESLGIPTD